MSQDKSSIWLMFDAIAPRYDFLNRLLSLRQDVIWRKKLVSYLPKEKIFTHLDVATGTGDVLLMVLKKLPSIEKVVGIDMSSQMLNLAKKKVAKSKHLDKVSLHIANAEELPFESNSFDSVSIAFGIRNVLNYRKALKDMHRLLKSNGRLLVLECSLPSSKIIRSIYLFYFRYILPILGGLISRNKKAYSYLNQSVEDFPSGDNFKNILLESGYSHVEVKPLFFGIASIYCAVK